MFVSLIQNVLEMSGGLTVPTGMTLMQSQGDLPTEQTCHLQQRYKLPSGCDLS